MSQETNQKQLPEGTVLHDGQHEYEIIKVLGEGSFGITYLAWLRDASAPGSQPRQVAVKEFFMHDINGRQNGLVTSSVMDGMYDKYMRKFKNEASALNRLNHENIVRVHSCFEANNTVYYAMEFLNGGSIDDDLAANGPLPQQQVLKLAAQVASALSYLHSSNMLHLDLKPSNIMLRDRDHVALIDFGLAKQFDDSGNPESSTTIGGGTPGYAPIEQQNSVELANFYGGKSSVLPVTMDIYAFGATLYKMLVGKMPPMPDEILDNDVLPPQCLYERQVRPELIEVLTKAMKPRKKDRYQSVAEMYAAIEPLLQPGEEVKIWTQADLKAQPAAPAQPEPPMQKPEAVRPDEGTVVAGAQRQKPANPWETAPSQAPANPFGTSTVMVDRKKKKTEKKPDGGNGQSAGGSKLGLIIGVCAALLIAAGAIAYFLTREDQPEGEEIVVVDPVPAENPTPVDTPVAGDDDKTDVADPIVTEPVVTEPVVAESVVTEPVVAEPQAEPAKPEKPQTPAQPKTRNVLGGKAVYDASARTITFSAPYNLKVGDNVISLPAGAVLQKVALHPNGRLRSCVYNGDRYDGINTAL